MNIKGLVKKIPVIGRIASHFYRKFRRFPGSLNYWEHRYKSGGVSGKASKGRLAAFRAGVINSFVKQNNIELVVEYGCGDGLQLSFANYPRYIGLDVSHEAIELCKKRFSIDNSKEFFVLEPKLYQKSFDLPLSGLSLSLDVIYHLIEDEVFHQHMSDLFNPSLKYAIICSSNYDDNQDYHQKPRKFTKWIDKHAPDWKLIQKINNPYPYDPSNPENTSESDFYIFRKVR